MSRLFQVIFPTVTNPQYENSPEGIILFHLHLLGSFFLFFLFFYRSTCFGSAWSFGLKDFLSQIYSIAFFSFLNSSERASIFPFNVECLLSIPTFDICSSFLCVYLHMYVFCANWKKNRSFSTVKLWVILNLKKINTAQHNTIMV